MSLFQQIQESSFSLFIRESLIIYPAITVLHIIALSLSLGLLGFQHLKYLKVVQYREEYPNIMIISFICLFLSGGLLFISSPLNYIGNSFFIAKVIFIFLLGLNVFSFYKIKKKKIHIIFSLSLWPFVIILGKLLAIKGN